MPQNMICQYFMSGRTSCWLDVGKKYFKGWFSDFIRLVLVVLLDPPTDLTKPSWESIGPQSDCPSPPGKTVLQ